MQEKADSIVGSNGHRCYRFLKLFHYRRLIFPQIVVIEVYALGLVSVWSDSQKVVRYRKTMSDNAAKVCSPIIRGALSFALCFFVFCSFCDGDSPRFSLIL